MGFRKRASNDWDLRIDGAEPIAYLRIEEVLASTPHELRQMASKLESDGAKALVLDLRWLHRAELHPTVLLADSLLDGGIIGRVRTADGIVTYRAEPDALIPSMPLVVMTSPETAGPGVWLAAALADNRHAKIAATSRMAPRRAANDFRNASRVNASVPVGDGAWWITLTTGVLELADGRPLALGASPGDLQAVASIEEPATLKSPQDANLHILQTVPLRDLSKPGAGAADIVPARTETEKLREQLNAIVEQSNEYKRAETKLNEQIRALERELNAPSGRPGSTNGKTQGPAGPPQMHTPPVDADGEWILSRDHPLQQAVQVLKQALRSP
jgi:hypothetical protein